MKVITIKIYNLSEIKFFAEGFWYKFKNQRLHRWKWKVIHWYKGTKPISPKKVDLHNDGFVERPFVYPNSIDSLPGKEGGLFI